MIGSIFFIFNRLTEITFLIPIIGMMVRPLPSPSDRPDQTLTNNTGLLRRRLPQSQHDNTALYPRPLYRLRNRRLLVRRHSNPALDHQALRFIRLLRRPPLLRRLHRRRIPAALHRKRQLRRLGRRQRLQRTRPIRIPWSANEQPAR